MTGNRTSALNCGSYRGVALFVTLETRTTSRTKFHFKSSRLSEKKKYSPKNYSVLFCARKISTVIFIDEGLPLSRSENDFSSTYLRHCDILAKSCEKPVIK